MDRNSLTGFILICLLSLAYFWYTAPSAEQIERERQKRDSIELTQKTNTDAIKENQPTKTELKR